MQYLQNNEINTFFNIVSLNSKKYKHRPTDYLEYIICNSALVE